MQAALPGAATAAAVVAVLHVHTSSSDVQAHGCRLLGALAEEGARAGGIEAVVAAAQGHAEHDEVVLHAVGALRAMLWWPETSDVHQPLPDALSQRLQAAVAAGAVEALAALLARLTASWSRGGDIPDWRAIYSPSSAARQRAAPLPPA